MGRDHPIDYFRCVSFIFFLSFKPSEPHLSAYLKEVKHLTKQQRDAEVYTVYTYGSVAVVVLLALWKLVSLRGVQLSWIRNDKFIIIIGCCGGIATHLLLLFGEGLRMMQLMQVVYSVGVVGELAFYAYCLKVAPKHSQRLTAWTQSSHLVSHTCAGFVGDWLLSHTTVGLVGLMWISACSVFTASLVACTFRKVEPELMVAAPSPTEVMRATYKSRSFWLCSLWWVASYPLYQTIYGYESSIYADNITTHDYNGTIFAVGLLAGASCSMLLSFEGVEKVTSRMPMPLLVLSLLSFVLTVATGVIAWDASNEWALAVSFGAFFMSYSFANTLFFGETRRAVDSGMTLLTMPAPDRDALATRVVSTVVIFNSALGTVVNALLSFVVFTCLELDVEIVFQQLSVLQATLTFVFVLMSCARSWTGQANTVMDGTAVAQFKEGSTLICADPA